MRVREDGDEQHVHAAAQHERARVGIDRLAHAAHTTHGQTLLMRRCSRGFDDGQAGSKAACGAITLLLKLEF